MSDIKHTEPQTEETKPTVVESATAAVSNTAAAVSNKLNLEGNVFSMFGGAPKAKREEVDDEDEPSGSSKATKERAADEVGISFLKYLQVTIARPWANSGSK